MSRLAPRVSGAAAPLLLLGALSTFGPLAIDVYLPALPALAADLRASTVSAQLTLTACLLGLALGQLVAGPVSDRVGRRRPLLAALLAFAAASVVCAVAPSVAVLLVGRLVQGVAGGASIVIARATVRDVNEGDAAARAYATLALVQTLAPVLAPTVGGQLLRFTDWRGVFIAIGLFALLLGVLAALRAGETRGRVAEPAGGVGLATVASLKIYGRLLTDPRVLRPGLVVGAASASLFAYVAGSSFTLQADYGLSAQAFSLAFAGMGAAIFTVGRLNRLIVGRIRPVTLLRAGAAQSAIGSLLLVAAIAAALPVGFVLAALAVSVSSVGLIFPNGITLVMADQPDAAGSAGALIGLMQFVAGGLAAPLVGLGGEVGQTMAIVMAGGSVCAVALAATVRR